MPQGSGATAAGIALGTELLGWGKAAAKFHRLAPTSEVPVVFLHTGGLPGFYGYVPEAVAQF